MNEVHSEFFFSVTNGGGLSEGVDYSFRAFWVFLIISGDAMNSNIFLVEWGGTKGFHLKCINGIGNFNFDFI